MKKRSKVTSIALDDIAAGVFGGHHPGHDDPVQGREVRKVREEQGRDTALLPFG